MTDVVHSPALVAGTAVRWRLTQAAARLRASIERRIISARTRRALDDLSDELLRDNGLTRGDIPFVAEAIASGRGDVTRGPCDRFNRNLLHRA